MITSNVIHRTFHMRYGTSAGTTFALDRDGKQYLITARHVVEGITSGSSVAILHDEQWKDMPLEVVGIGTGELDVAVLSCRGRLAPPHPLEASSEGLTYSQRVYFLGFPFGWGGGWEHLNREFPLPLVKSGIISAMPSGSPSRIYIDAHNNKGFSGGPVVFVPNGGPGNEFRVAGVVANYPTPLVEPVIDGAGTVIGYFRENQGFVVAFDIRHATELIDANPIGFELPAGQNS